MPEKACRKMKRLPSFFRFTMRLQFEPLKGITGSDDKNGQKSGRTGMQRKGSEGFAIFIPADGGERPGGGARAADSVFAGGEEHPFCYGEILH